MFEQFTWRGKPIVPEDFCRERGEAMVHYHAERMAPSPWPAVSLLIKEEYDGKMPETFWNGLVSKDGWSYTEVRREQP